MEKKIVKNKPVHVGRSVVTLTLDATALNKGLEDAKKKLADFGKKLADVGKSQPKKKKPIKKTK